MSRFRYPSSFILTVMVYALLILLYMTFLKTTKPILKPKEHIVKVALITPAVVKKVITPVVPPKPKVKKPKPKKIVKKVKPKLQPKPKKIIKNLIPLPEPIIEEIYEEEIIYTEAVIEPIVEEVYEEEIIYEVPTIEPIYHEPTVAQHIATSPQIVEVSAPQVDLEGKKGEFLNRIRANIHTNKKYPKMAKRRNIQGRVHAIFDIQIYGTATNIRLSGASSVLEKAVRKSIEKSFPTAIPIELMGKFPISDVSVNVDFILE